MTISHSRSRASKGGVSVRLSSFGWTRAACAVAVGVVTLAAASDAFASLAPGDGGPGPAQVPCNSIGGGKYNCTFWPAGDGIHGGAPVLNSAGTRVGYLNQGTNWIICQRPGQTLTNGSTKNNWWAYTEANDLKWGWVNAIYAHGGTNFGDFQGVPLCTNRGNPPGGSGSSPAPTPPSPPPAPAPGPAQPPDQGGPAPVPCTSIGGGKHQCQFWPAGDGIHNGAPVLSSKSKRVGFLNSGSNWVICERFGATVKQGSLANHWWAWTEANDHRWGWVNALYGRGGDNYGDFGGVPACDTSHGYPPGGAPPSPPPHQRRPPSPGPTLRQRANRIMNMTYSAFIAYKRDVHPRPFDWNTDGCSIPGRHAPDWVGALVRSVANLFNQPCQLHDFGYRNYGKGLKLAPDENTRHWIDDRFYHEMQRLCNHKYHAWYRIANKEACLNEAHSMFLAVRAFGHF